jgi:hypothetical protein
MKQLLKAAGAVVLSAAVALGGCGEPCPPATVKRCVTYREPMDPMKAAMVKRLIDEGNYGIAYAYINAQERTDCECR